MAEQDTTSISDQYRGLTTAEAQSRLRQYGPNAVVEEKTHPVKVFVRRFWAPIPWLLEATIVIQLFLGEWLEAVVIGGLLALNATLSMLQEGRARKALALLRQQLRVSARVYRDGAWATLAAEGLVTGDVVHLRQGTIVPADVMLEDGSLLVDQSALTGESAAVSLEPGKTAYAGSMVRGGESTGEVTATGVRTFFGKTAELVRTAGSANRQEREIVGVVKNLFVVNAAMVVVVIGYAHYAGMTLGFILPLLLTILLASIPVALPATFTLAAALGSVELSKFGVLITRLSALHDIASMTVPRFAGQAKATASSRGRLQQFTNLGDSSMTTNRFDVIILGAGPAGERAAVQAGRSGRRVALVEREHVVGGTCVNWGTIPSKTLRESAVHIWGLKNSRIEGIRSEITDQITMAGFMYRERQVVQRELELINRTLDKYTIQLFEGTGSFIDPHTVSITGKDGRDRLRIQGEVIVIATGSVPNRPADISFDDTRVFDSNTILRLTRMPESMLLLGAGVIGVEYASIFAALGIEVTLVDTREQLLPYLDREIAAQLAHNLKKLGILLVPEDRYERIEILRKRKPTVCCHAQSGNVFEADVLLYCVGRDGDTRNLGLERIGIKPNERGLLEVNEFFQTTQPHIYAVGDVIGYPALTSTSAEQGRQAIRHAFNIPGPRARTEMLPFAIYTIPEISFIGRSEEDMRKDGIDYVLGRAQYGMNPRGQILGDVDGVLKLIFEAESLRLLGVHIIGTNASELIHIGQAFLRNESDAWQIAETIYNYPTLSDMYRHAALEAVAFKRRRTVDDESRRSISPDYQSTEKASR